MQLPQQISSPRLTSLASTYVQLVVLQPSKEGLQLFEQP
jgi:hypothetical protein